MKDTEGRIVRALARGKCLDADRHLGITCSADCYRDNPCLSCRARNFLRARKKAVKGRKA